MNRVPFSGNGVLNADLDRSIAHLQNNDLLSEIGFFHLGRGNMGDCEPLFGEIGQQVKKQLEGFQAVGFHTVITPLLVD